MKLKIYLVLIIISLPLWGYEINTHQAITHCAITNNCNQSGSENLNNFVLNTKLDKEDYKNQNFKYYGKTYLKYAEKGSGLKEKLTDFRKNKGEFYIDMIEAGSILEDAIYPNATFSGDGRFNNHFYSAQTPISINLLQSKATVFHNSLRLNDRALFADGMFDAFGPRTDNISWALQKDVSVGVIT